MLFGVMSKVTLGKLDKNIQIEIRSNPPYGVGARRMFEWIEQWQNSGLSLQTNWAHCWKGVQLCCPAEDSFSVGVGLAVKGELTITRSGFTLQYQARVPILKSLHGSELREPSYSAMSQKFKFTIGERQFTLQGNQAQLLNHLMDVFSKQRCLCRLFMGNPMGRRQ